MLAFGFAMDFIKRKKILMAQKGLSTI